VPGEIRFSVEIRRGSGNDEGRSRTESSAPLIIRDAVRPKCIAGL